MKKGVNASSLAGGSKVKRVDNDYYATDPNSIVDFLNTHKEYGSVLNGDSFYEPCCGAGHISKVLKDYFPKAEHYATDLVYRGYGTGGVDFIQDDVLKNILGGKKVDWIITNPPFSLGKEFVDKSLSITKKGVAMFMKIQFLESVSREDWFRKGNIRYVYQFSKRQVIFRNGVELDPKTNKPWANTMSFAMFVWEHGYLGEPKIRWI